jgi:hypothetical protein
VSKRRPGFFVITIDIAAALLCVAGTCHPVLVGQETPRGDFLLIPTEQPGYGVVLSFFETDTDRYAIHPTVPGRERLYAAPAGRRARVTAGCVNVPPALFLTLLRDHAGAALAIR